MNFFSRLKNSMLVLLIATFLFSCSGKTENMSTASNNSLTHIKNAKPGAPVKLSSASMISIQQNQLKNTEILLETTEALGELSIELTSSDGLGLTDTSTHRVISLPSSSPIKIPVSLIATANGRYYLHIRASLNNGDSVATRNLAVIVQVGDQSLASSSENKQLKKTAVENVISLPAQESISSQ